MKVRLSLLLHNNIPEIFHTGVLQVKGARDAPLVQFLFKSKTERYHI
jgi:hypothetical protein